MLRRVPVAFRHAGVGLLDHPVPAKEFRLPHGRPTSRSHWPDLDGVATLPTCETRSGWAPS
jgi:hypothetical protein